jgi:hypothetical protein
MAVAALVLGIIAAALFFIFFISIPCGILAVIFGILGVRKANTGVGRKGMALAGAIVGGVGIVLSVLFVAVINEAGNEIEEDLQQLEEDLEDIEITP